MSSESEDQGPRLAKDEEEWRGVESRNAQKCDAADADESKNGAPADTTNGERSLGHVEGGGGSGGDDEDDEEGELGVRTLFEMSFPTRKVSLEIPVEAATNGAPQILLEVICADFDNPGALQSGKFVWPASRGLAEFLGSRAGSEFVRGARSVIELGAGAGVGGLALAKLASLDSGEPRRLDVLFTDRDKFLLDMIEESVHANGWPEWVRFRTSELRWGQARASEARALAEAADGGSGFDLVLGADLSYSTESSMALIETAAELLCAPRSRFLLCSSFRVPETTAIIESHASRLGLERTVLVDELREHGAAGRLVELFSQQPNR